MEIHRIGADDADSVVVAGDLFDNAPRFEATLRFLGDPNHILFIAYEGDRPVGFVSGVLITHPDKGTEMFLYELSVKEELRLRGIGTALVNAIRDLAIEHGCYDMWVLTDAENAAALATYTSTGASDREDTVMLTWHFDEEQR